MGPRVCRKNRVSLPPRCVAPLIWSKSPNGRCIKEAVSLLHESVFRFLLVAYITPLIRSASPNGRQMKMGCFGRSCNGLSSDLARVCYVWYVRVAVFRAPATGAPVTRAAWPGRLAACPWLTTPPLLRPTLRGARAFGHPSPRADTIVAMGKVPDFLLWFASFLAGLATPPEDVSLLQALLSFPLCSCFTWNTAGNASVIRRETCPEWGTRWRWAVRPRTGSGELPARAPCRPGQEGIGSPEIWTLPRRGEGKRYSNTITGWTYFRTMAWPSFDKTNSMNFDRSGLGWSSR